MKYQMRTASKVLSAWAICFVLASGVSPTAHAENERVTKPTAVSLELFGRGLLYTVEADSMLADNLGAGFGFGTVGLKQHNGPDLNNSAKLMPVYVNYYFQDEQGSLFLTLGASLIFNQNDVKGNDSTIGNVNFSSSGVQPSFGLGYENRGPTGMLLRITGYGIVGKQIYPWFGFSLGYAF